MVNCLLLLHYSTHGSLSGLGLIGIKDEEESTIPQTCVCESAHHLPGVIS